MKFRMWDEKRNCWDNESIMVYPNEPILKQGRTIQWYTGLKDKNNKDIYVGDIVKTIYRKDPYLHIGEVIFNTDTGSFRILTPNNKLLPIVTFRCKESNEQGLLQVADEVVGNIFELPCKPDHNGECLTCDNSITECDFRK